MAENYIVPLSPENRLLMLAAQTAVVRASYVRDTLMKNFVRQAVHTDSCQAAPDVVLEMNVEPNGDIRLVEQE